MLHYINYNEIVTALEVLSTTIAPSSSEFQTDCIRSCIVKLPANDVPLIADDMNTGHASRRCCSSRPEMVLGASRAVAVAQMQLLLAPSVHAIRITSSIAL